MRTGEAAMVTMRWIVLGTLLAAASAHAERVTGTSVTLEPPAGFVQETRFPGFGDAGRGASIMVTEIPGPIAQVRAGMTKTGLAGRGMTLVESEETKVGGEEAQLVRVTQSAAGVTYEKWLLLVGSASSSVVVVATYKEGDAPSLRESMKRALLSTHRAAGEAGDRLEGLTFRIDETERLKIASRVSNLLILTAGGVAGPVDPENALLVVGASINDVDLSDLAAFAERRLRQIEQVSGVAHLEGAALEVGGLPAYELTATASDKSTAKPLRVYQLVVADGSTYFLAQGLVGATKAGEFVPEFRAVARSLRRTE